jgi:hypothetical protein
VERPLDEVGAVLILALVYIISISMVVGALADFAMNDLNNTTKFSAASTEHYAVTGVAQLAIQTIRYAPIPSNPTAAELGTPPTPSPLGECWVPTSGYVSMSSAVDNDPVAVWCTTTINLASANTRIVTFYACPTSLTSSSTSPQVSAAAARCVANPYLTTVVAFDDYPSGGAAPLAVQCNLGDGQCGEGSTLETWTWGAVAGIGYVSSAASATFSAQPGTVNAGVADGASVTVLNASSSPVVGDTVTISVNSGPGGLDGSSTVSATTNSSGIAVFSNLVFDTSGSYTLLATDGVVSATSSSFSVNARQAQTVAFYNSSHTSIITSGSATYSPSGTYQLYAAGSGGGAISFNSSTTGVCTVNLVTGLATIVTAGTCSLTADAAGNSTYADSGPTGFTLTISQGATATTVVSTTGSPSAINQAVTYTATVTATSPSSGNPSGNVEFFNAGTAINGCTAQALSASSPDTAACTVVYTVTGSHVITAQYLGSTGTYSASAVSSSITQVVSSTSGDYTGSSTVNLPSTPTYFSINGASAGSSTDTFDEVTPGTAETITGLTFTMGSSSSTNHTATVGYITSGGVWTSTGISCTVTGGSGQTVCTASGSFSVPVGDSLNILAVGNGNHTGSWVTTYTQP